MTTLLRKQIKFSQMVGLLLTYAYSIGYQITLGDAWAKTGHMNNSKHYSRRAIDLNLFKDGVYLTTTEDHRELGEYWEHIGGIWGGRFNDGNHYEI